MGRSQFLALVLGVFASLAVQASSQFFMVVVDDADPNKTRTMKIEFSVDGSRAQVLFDRVQTVPHRGTVRAVAHSPRWLNNMDNHHGAVPFVVVRSEATFAEPVAAVIVTDNELKKEKLVHVANGISTVFELPQRFTNPVEMQIFPVDFDNRNGSVVTIFDPKTKTNLGYYFKGSIPYEIQSLALQKEKIFRTEAQYDRITLNNYEYGILRLARSEYTRINAEGEMRNKGPSQNLDHRRFRHLRQTSSVASVSQSRALVPVVSTAETNSGLAPELGANGEPEREGRPAYDPERLLELPLVKQMTVHDASNKDEKPVPLVQFLKQKFDIVRDVELREQDFEYFEKELKLAETGLLMRQTGGVRVTGRPGTGKSHFTRVLLSYLLNRSEAQAFQDKIYLRMNTADLVAGTKWVGNFETKIQALKTLSKVVPVVLVVEELHSLVGAGTHSGNQNDIFQMLKEEFADGRIKIVGNLTDVEWQRYFSGDRAMIRRLPINIQIGETKSELLMPIGQKFLAEHYQGHVTATNETIEAIAKIANRFDPIAANPGKMIQLLDFLAANAQSSGQKEITSQSILENASLLYNYDLKELTPERINERIRNLQNFLDERLIGQSAAKELATRALADHFLHQQNSTDTRPTSMIFYGDRGAGKTTLARAIADGLTFKFHRIMMSEFAHDANAEEFKTRLAMELKNNPFQVVLLDEIEKAHRSVQFVLLRVLDEGRFEANLSKLSMHQGDVSEIDASKAILIAATNAAKQIANQPANRAAFPMVAEQDGLDRYVLDRIPTHIPVESPNGQSVRGILRKYLREHIESFTKIGKTVTLNEDKMVEYLLELVKPEIK